MGVHDYVCFVERNGQCLMGPVETSPEESESSNDEELEGGCGFTTAILVMVPIKYTKREIISWSLDKFKEFEMREEEYSWDSWGFENIEGYRDVLHSQSYIYTLSEWVNLSIWQSDDIPGFWLVNFHPEIYRIFVLGNKEAKNISKLYYKWIFKNRGVTCPKSKEQAFDKIINAGDENLWNYDGKKIKRIKIPKDLTVMEKSLMKRPLFKKDFGYEFETPNDPNLFKDRLKFILQDHIKCEEKLLSVHQSYSEQIWIKFNPGGISIMKFHFTPKLNCDIDEDLIDGCLKCQKQRWTGSYFCLDHINFDYQTAYKQVKKRIKEQSKDLIENIEKYEGIDVPLNLYCKFTEKGKHYDLKLTLTH